MSSTQASSTIHLDDFLAIDGVSGNTKQQLDAFAGIDSFGLDAQTHAHSGALAPAFPFDLGSAADTVVEHLDLEKQQQHHLRQFLYYQSLALERQRSAILQQQAVAVAAPTSISSVPSLSPPSSLPPSPRSTTSEALTFSSATPPADVSAWSTEIDAMQAYQQAPMAAGQGGNSFSGNGQAARPLAFPSQPYQVTSARHSISAYPSADGAGMGFQPAVYQLSGSGRGSLDASSFAQSQSIAKNGRAMSASTPDYNGFTAMQTMQAHARSQAQQANASELVKGPYMMGSSAPAQAQQQQRYYGVESFNGRENAQQQQQGFNINYNTAMPSYLPTSVDDPRSGMPAPLPYAAPDMSMPAFFRMHSADPAAANGQNVGVTPDSVSPRTSASDPTGREDVQTKMSYRESASFASLPQSSVPMSRTASTSAEHEGDKVVLNPLGGGRGYVPGETPDDPKKRHKCDVCGRGFARLFNLKSHSQTHDPQRPKPHVCPHETCARSFSRLHDLERHRQGVHYDGPLMVAKRQGISPSIARAQSRIAKRAERGTLV